MNKIFTTSLLLISAIILSGISILFFNVENRKVIATDPQKPDAYLQDVKAIILNNAGKPSLEVTSPQMIHFPFNDTTAITFPKVTMFKETMEHWFINADSAKAVDGINTITFNDKVNIVHPADADNPLTTVLTNYLTVFPNQQLARTNAEVTFHQPDTIVHAIGMEANFKLGLIKLLSKATGEYVPHS